MDLFILSVAVANMEPFLKRIGRQTTNPHVERRTEEHRDDRTPPMEEVIPVGEPPRRSAQQVNMASNFRHLTGCEDGTGTFCCYGKSRRQRQITGRGAPEHRRTSKAMLTA